MLGENLFLWRLSRPYLGDAVLTRIHSDYFIQRHHPPFISWGRRHWEVSSHFLDEGELKGKLKKKIISLLCDLKMTVCFLTHDFFLLLFCVHLIKWCHFFQVEFNQNSVVLVIGIHVLWAELEDDPRFLSSFALCPVLAKDILSLLCLWKKFQMGVRRLLAVVSQELLLSLGLCICNQRYHCVGGAFGSRCERFSSEECAGELYFAISGIEK